MISKFIELLPVDAISQQLLSSDPKRLGTIFSFLRVRPPGGHSILQQLVSTSLEFHSIRARLRVTFSQLKQAAPNCYRLVKALCAGLKNFPQEQG